MKKNTIGLKMSILGILISLFNARAAGTEIAKCTQLRESVGNRRFEFSLTNQAGSHWTFETVETSSLRKFGPVNVEECRYSSSSEDKYIEWINCFTVGGENPVHIVELRIRVGQDNGGTSDIKMKYADPVSHKNVILNLHGKYQDCALTEFYQE